MNFKQKFEPKGNKVIHGAGQEGNPFVDAKDFRDYWNSIGKNKPILFMTYIQLKYVNKKWFKLIQKQIKDFPNVLLQIGLSMTDTHSGEPKKHYEHEVLKGKYDKNIKDFYEGIEKLKKPCFVRLGYEFNGLSWYGYRPKPFIKAWKYVADKCNIKNIAWVWHYASSGEKNYMDYYPGDKYVDWWGITIFSPKHLKDSGKFIKEAEKHKKPIMIAESSAIKNMKWGWFKSYFNFIKDNPSIKAFCYINWNWEEKEKVWKGWGDCRVSHNKKIREKYVKEISKKKYIHNISTNKFLKLVNKIR